MERLNNINIDLQAGAQVAINVAEGAPGRGLTIAANKHATSRTIPRDCSKIASMTCMYACNITGTEAGKTIDNGSLGSLDSDAYRKELGVSSPYHGLPSSSSSMPASTSTSPTSSTFDIKFWGVRQGRGDNHNQEMYKRYVPFLILLKALLTYFCGDDDRSSYNLVWVFDPGEQNSEPLLPYYPQVSIFFEYHGLSAILRLAKNTKDLAILWEH
ncbi:hypothetical protein BYT27DRAFT_7264704 [Phlegmacium glaucopus]|nr:hypothetical protein BYT27DRAFT_7264704 [Phlegmacium glaucopus]